MVRTACLVCLISTVNGRSKIRGNHRRLAVVADTQQTLSNLIVTFDIYGLDPNLGVTKFADVRCII